MTQIFNLVVKSQMQTKEALSYFWISFFSLMLMQLELVHVLVNAVRSNAHVEEADTDFTFGYMLIVMF